MIPKRCGASTSLPTASTMSTMEADALQISSTSDETAQAQDPDSSFGLSVVATARRGSESDSSPRAVVSARPSRASSPYHRNRSASRPKHGYACEVAKPPMPTPSGSPVSFEPTHDAPSGLHLHRHQQLGVVVQGVDPRVHSQALAQAQIVENQAVALVTGVQQQAEQQVQTIAGQAAALVEGVQHQAEQHVQTIAGQAQQAFQQQQAETSALRQQNEALTHQVALLQSMVAELKASSVNTSVPKCPQVAIMARALI